MSEKITEKASNYSSLEKLSVHDLLTSINKEDQTVPLAIEKVLDRIENAVILIAEKIRQGGRLFYIGAGTSGRLGIVDASELPPTYGLPHGIVIAIIAGGDAAIRKAVEFAEDDNEQGWKDLRSYDINEKDVVLGIAASGSTPYVIGAMKHSRNSKILTIGLTCNPDSDLAKSVDLAIEVVVGPEVVTGSTRMKAGTAQKLVLNMISTCVMIRLGRIKGNKMVDMQLTNDKLVERGIKMIIDELSVSYEEASQLLRKFGSVRKVLDQHHSN